MEFDENVPFINKVEFCIGGYFNGYETRTYTIDGDKVHTNIEHSLILKPSNIGDFEIEEMDKDYLLASMGLLAEIDPLLALKIMKKHVIAV